MGRKRKYTLNENYFENIDNQEKAYFLGFMYADGNVSSKSNRCKIKLQEKDKAILEKFQSLLETNSPLYWNKKYKSWMLSFTSSKIKQDLIKIGCMSCKTFKVEFPSWLRENLKPHFIRGFLDGDGSIFITKKNWLRVTIAGREEFLKNILNLCKINGHIRKQRNVWILHFGSSFAVSFLTWLYKDATIYLERKRNKFLEYLRYRRKYEEKYREIKSNDHRFKLKTNWLDFQYLGI